MTYNQGWNDAIEAARMMLIECASFHRNIHPNWAAVEMNRAEDLEYMKKTTEPHICEASGYKCERVK